MNTTLQKCSPPRKPDDPFFAQFHNAAGAYKPGDRVGKDCLCYDNIWSPNCCKGGLQVHSASTSFNMVGPFGLGSGCGPRPVGVGKNHKAKLDAWNTCMDQSRQREAAKKQAKIDQKQADAMSNAALAQALGQPAGGGAPGDGSAARTAGGDSGAPDAGGFSMAAKIAIGVGIATVVIGGVFAVLAMTKKKKKA